MKILIITPSIGEPQLALQDEQINLLSQRGCYEIDRQVLIGLTAAEALRKVHAEAHAAKSYDFVIKLDADMTFRSLESFDDLMRVANNTQEGRLTIPVFDYVTRLSIYGCHILRPSAVPPSVTIDELHRDDWIGHIPGKVMSLRSRFVDHCIHPSELQCFTFGYNRGHKFRQKGQNTLYVVVASCILGLTNSKARLVLQGFILGYFSANRSFDSNLIEELFKDRKRSTFRQKMRFCLSNLSALFGAFFEYMRLIFLGWPR